MGNYTLAFDWCHFWWPWSTFEGHFSLRCHFHVYFSNPWHAFASHGLPAIAELLVNDVSDRNCNEKVLHYYISQITVKSGDCLCLVLTAILALGRVGSDHGSLITVISSKIWVGSEFVWVGSGRVQKSDPRQTLIPTATHCCYCLFLLFLFLLTLNKLTFDHTDVLRHCRLWCLFVTKCWAINLWFNPHLWFNFFNFGALPNILHYITKTEPEHQRRTLKHHPLTSVQPFSKLSVISI